MCELQIVSLVIGLLAALQLSNCEVVTKDSYEEHLVIKHIGKGLLHSKFDFVTTTDLNIVLQGHFDLFPKSLGEVIKKYHVHELEVTLTQGVWRYPIWGMPSRESVNPSGASVLAIFDESVMDVDRAWKGLVNSLAGMTCASLNFIDETNTVCPKYTLYPRGAIRAKKPFQNSLLRYSIIAQENVCTENLTPFKKLLPCAGRAGLSAFLVAKPLFDSRYTSISMAIRSVCSNPKCTSTRLELRQTVSTVFNYFSRGTPQNGWSLKSLLGSISQNKCHLASKSDIMVDVPTSSTLSPSADEEKRTGDRILARYPFTNQIKVTDESSAKYVDSLKPSLFAHRYLAGYGQEHGTLVCEIMNRNEEAVQVVYTDFIPWFLRVYLHTLSIKNGDNTISAKKINYTPGLERKRPYLLELLLELPANTTTTISLDVDKLFLQWTEFNPDANLGVFIPSSTITAVLPDAPTDATIQQLDNDYGVVRIYTEKLLVALPTPDFSMPYNVICLACTVVAIGFGSFYNLSAKIFVDETGAKPSLMQRVKAKLFGKKAIAEPVTEDTPQAKSEDKQEDNSPDNEEKKGDNSTERSETDTAKGDRDKKED